MLTASRTATPRALPTRVRSDKVRRRRDPAWLSAATNAGRDPSGNRPQVAARDLSGVASGGAVRDPAVAPSHSSDKTDSRTG